ncbi:hypothetical protein FIBSPDRAFT_274675 [Athelia psychrophila]|uniref:Uncharacterized protein n=1 Tax=Athelia psychrophila TaxID=1759441 RepID=A0A166RB92_9AGAM|nr:hypothetical protein FIBSPDRAFT_274675 [Fibularhizoctonia sp. CBS 109695]
MSIKAIFKTLKKRFGKKERAGPSGPFLLNVMMIPEVRRETELALELRGRSAASMMVDAECAQLREMLGRKVDMVGRKSSEVAQSISIKSVVAPSDDASSLAGIIDANDKDAKGPISLSTGLKASRDRDAPAERDVLCLMNFGHSSNRSAVTDAKSAVAVMSRRLKDDVKIAAHSEKAVLAMMG